MPLDIRLTSSVAVAVAAALSCPLVQAAKLPARQADACYCAVKALEYANYQAEISTWERRFLLPQV